MPRIYDPEDSGDQEEGAGMTGEPGEGDQPAETREGGWHPDPQAGGKVPEPEAGRRSPEPETGEDEEPTA